MSEHEKCTEIVFVDFSCEFLAHSSLAGTKWQTIRGNFVEITSGVASSISEGDIFIYSCFAQLISFEIDSISKEINCAEHEYIEYAPLTYRAGDATGNNYNFHWLLLTSTCKSKKIIVLSMIFYSHICQA